MLKRTLISFALMTYCGVAPAGEFTDALWENIKSPTLKPARYAIYAGSALTLSLVLLEKQVVDPVQEEAVESKPLGRSSKYGDKLGQLYPNLAYVLGMYGYGAIYKDQDALTNSSLMLQATIYSSVVATALKYTVRERRPDNPKIKNSFPSGHTTTIFAFASYIGCRHSLPWGIAAYSAAAFVGFSRMNDNAHWIHDVTAGATIGTAYGLGVCAAEKERATKKTPIETIGFLVPLDKGLAVGLSHSF